MFSQGYLSDTQLCIIALWLFYILLPHQRINLTTAHTYLPSLFPTAMLIPYSKASKFYDSEAFLFHPANAR